MRLSSIAGAAVLTAVCTNVVLPVANAQVDITNISFNPANVNYNPVTRVLTATGGTVTGTFAGAPFTTEITNFVLRPAQGQGRRCSVLDLALGPINLDLLGLNVDTSPICLTIDAFRGEGVLGDLLCGLTGGGLLANLGPLGESLEEILNVALDRARRTPPGQGGNPPGQGGNPPGQGGNPPGQGGDSVCSGDCEVLNLVLGPLTLNLLGVQVKLNNCEGGPVQVCISATADEGILGALLCALTGPDLLNLVLGDIIELIELAQELLDEGASDAVILRELTALLGSLLGL